MRQEAIFYGEVRVHEEFVSFGIFCGLLKKKLLYLRYLKFNWLNVQNIELC